MTNEQPLELDDVQSFEEAPLAEINEGESTEEKKERLFNSKQTSEIVKREREKAYQKGRRDLMSELEKEQASESNQQDYSGNPFSMDQIRQIIADETPRFIEEKAAELRYNEVAKSFVHKMQAAQEKHPELMQDLEKLDYHGLAPLIPMVTELDNTAEIMKELIDHPTKMSHVMLLMEKQPHLAMKELFNLNKSINMNQEALSHEKSARQPLDQLKSSSGAGMSNEKNMSVADFRKMLRG